MSKTIPGLVSVVLVNYKGTDDTIQAVKHLKELEWPADRLEIIVVENASGDDSFERLSALGDQIVLVNSTENRGFAGGCNLGVARASGEYLAFLNNDARPDRHWVTAAVERFEESPRIGAVATKVLDWDGENVDFLDAGLTWYGMGYKPLTGEKYTRELIAPGADVLFGTGSSMFVRHDVYDILGGFDERYFMFFEDVDFGWRLNLRGWRFAYEPRSVAYHKHHASMTTFGRWREQYLLERNALFTIYKNLGDDALGRTLAATMALSLRRGLSKAGVDTDELDIRRKSGAEQDERAVSKDVLAPVYAIDRFVDSLPELTDARAEIQANRQVSDKHIASLFRETDVPASLDRNYLDGYIKITNAFGLTDPSPNTRVLVITGDPIGAKLAGPGIRAWAMADALAESNDVRLVSLNVMEATSARFQTAHVAIGDQRAMRHHEEWADVIVFQGLAMALYRSISETDKILVADVYDPMHLEQLEQARGLGSAGWTTQVSDATKVLNQQLERADFLLCASDRQRHFYLGQLAALGRVNPANYSEDPDLENLLAIVPFGLSEEPPQHQRDVLRGVHDGIGPDDKILLWAGGLYNWFDPQTLIEAVGLVHEKHDDVRLFFQGTKNPNPGVPEMAIVEESRTKARDLGILDTAVFFNSSWVDFADRQNYLTEADAGVSTHHAHIETTFSFRTRILDYLWAELPMVVTEGDSFAELVKAENLGVVVPAGDAQKLANALEKVLYDEAYIAKVKKNIRRVRERFYWQTTLAPLVSFIEDARPAADRLERGLGEVKTPQTPRRRPTPMYGVRHDLSRVRHYLSDGGVSVVMGKVATRVKARLSAR